MWRAIAGRIAAQQRYACAHFFGGVQVYEYHEAVGALPALITPYESYSLYLRRELEAQTGPAPGARTRHFLARTLRVLDVHALSAAGGRGRT